VECLLAVLVDATTEHPFPITVIVPVQTAAKFLGTISDHLDRMGLVPSEEWSLKAEVEDQNVHLRFALISQEGADQLQAAIGNATLDDPCTPQLKGENVGFEIGGPASARFLDVFRIPRNTKMQPLEFRDPTDT
jgi:hypothetical protein